jgi:hypothetical protein
MLRRTEPAPPGTTAAVVYSLPSLAPLLATTIRTAVMPGALVPVFGGPDAKPYQCKVSNSVLSTHSLH